MNFNPEPNFPLINGPIQLPVPVHGRAARPLPLDYRETELPEPLHQASYPSTPVDPHGTSSLFSSTNHQRNRIIDPDIPVSTPSSLLLLLPLPLHLRNHTLNTVSILSVQLLILRLRLLINIVATRRKPTIIITPHQPNGLRTLNSRRSQPLNFLPFRKCILIPQQHTDIPIIEIIQTAETEIIGIIKININLITDLDNKCSDTLHQNSHRSVVLS